MEEINQIGDGVFTRVRVETNLDPGHVPCKKVTRIWGAITFEFPLIYRLLILASRFRHRCPA